MSGIEAVVAIDGMIWTAFFHRDALDKATEELGEGEVERAFEQGRLKFGKRMAPTLPVMWFDDLTSESRGRYYVKDEGDCP